jgi:hypothetical protein
MFKKLFVTAVLCIGMLAMSGTQEAKAWPRVGGWGLSFGSVTCDSFWKAIGNTDVNYARVECELLVEEVQLQCVNNGGGTGGLGTPFTFYGLIIGSELLTDQNLIGKGKAWSEITFTDQDLYDALFGGGYEFPQDVCQNPNWSVIPPESGGTIIITKTSVILSGYATNNRGEVILTDQVEGYCTLNMADPNDMFYECQ